MAFVYKVWNAQRNKKTTIALVDKEDGRLYESLILKASEKLQVDGSTLVLEIDGSEVDEDGVLQVLAKETFMLLTKNEKWEPPVTNNSLSFASTVTLNSSPSASSSPISSPTIPIQTEFLKNGNFEASDEKDSERVSEMTWKNFSLPLHKLSKFCMDECKKGNRKNKQVMTELIHSVVDSIREIKTDAPADAFKFASLKLVGKFPQMFEDRDDDGCVVGHGNHSVFCKMRERNNYLNRPHKRKSLKNDVHTTPKQRKLMIAAKAGCSNWQPDNHEDDPVNLQGKENFLKTVVTSNSNFEVNDDVKNAFDQTYSLQRLFINTDAPSVDQIRAKYPILLTNQGILLHYEKLMGHDVHNLKAAFHVKSDKILKFGIDKKMITTIPSTEEERAKSCFKIISNYFKEDYMVVLLTGNKEEDLVLFTNSPCLVESTYSEEASYSVYIEKQKIADFEHFLDALQFIFASYYVFNMAYPKEMGCTMEFIQRYMLKINPDQGSKNNKKKASSTLKIISFINKLRNMD